MDSNFSNRDYLAKCLCDCGFEENCTENFEKSCRNEKIRLLYNRRRALLDELHTVQREIDILDYMIKKISDN